MPRDPSTLSVVDRIGYQISNVAIRTILAIVGTIPYQLRVPAMGWLMSRVFGPLAGFRGRIRRNLLIAAPDMSKHDVNRLCRDVPDNIGRSLIEMYAGEPFLQRARRAKMHGPGLKQLEQARAEGRPILMVTGHFGNYNAARVKLIDAGFHLGGLYRRMANPYFNKHYVNVMEQISTPLYEQGRRGMSQMVRHLKSGGTIAILTDLHAHGGRELSFFGRPAITSVVPSQLALKYNALVVPIYGLRCPDGLSFEIIVQEPIPHSDADTMTQAINDGLQELTHKHMDQWFWIHRRWKPFYHLGLRDHELPKGY
jgi:KDO2-lipid IV(A) lauroyltransferase